MLKHLITWFISLFERDLSAITEEEIKPLKMQLQFFADGEDDDPEDDPEDDLEDEDPEDDVPNLDELLKDPKFKKQYNAKFKGQLSKRMKKFEGIDPEEYRQLKEKAGKKKEDKDDDDEIETLKSQLSEKEKRIERAERKEKRAMVKEFAVDNQVNPKLLSRLINVDDIELDEDGEAENLEELFEELEEEFPEYFSGADDDEEEDEPVKKKRKSSFVPGARQKSNKKKKVDPYEAGRLKAMERHGIKREEE